MSNNIKYYLFIYFGLTFLFFTGCQSDPPIPKPRTFPRMELQNKNPIIFNLESCPFTFDFPDYAEVKKDKTFFGEAPPHPCWFDLHIPAFDASIYLSYHDINGREDFDDLIRDTYKIANKINQRSDYMEEVRVQNENGIGGIKFLFEGAAASPIQFYMSDTTDHFLKGALYYNARVKADSMMPATNFLLTDIDLLLSSLEWK